MHAKTQDATLSPATQRTLGLILASLGDTDWPRHRPLPSHREWARRLGVSTRLVYQAMAHLKQRGMVEARQGSYTYLSAPLLGEHLNISNPSANLQTKIHIPSEAPRDIRKTRSIGLTKRFHREFLSAHPECILQDHSLSGPSAQNTAHLLEQLYSGSGRPTVFRLDLTYHEEFKRNGLTAPFAASYDRIQKLGGGFLPTHASTPLFTQSAVDFIPTHATHSFLICNLELLASSGISPEELARDWPSFMGHLSVLKERHARTPFWVSGADAPAFLFMNLLYLHAVSTRSPTLPPVDWKSEAAHEATHRFSSMLRQGLLHHDREPFTQFIGRVLDNRVAVTLDGGSLASTLASLGDAERFRILPLPPLPGGQHLSLANAGGWQMNAHTTPQERSAATAYVLAHEEWRLGPTGSTSMRRIGVPPSIFPIYHNDPTDWIPEHWREDLETILACSRQEPSGSDALKLQIAPTLNGLFGQTELPADGEILGRLRYVASELDLPNSEMEKR